MITSGFLDGLVAASWDVPFSTRHRNCGVNNNKVPTPIKLESTNKQAIQ